MFADVFWSYAVGAAVGAFIGCALGAQHGRVSERRRLQLDRARLELEKLDHLERTAKAVRDAHEHIGTVVRCTPFDQLERLGDVASRTVPGTNVLMRCQCGLVWLKWFPGVWTPDDFARTKPEDMDKALRSLTEGGNAP